VIDNNLNGTANTLRAFGPKLVKRGAGRIIVVSSMQGKHGSKTMSSYSASKWGIIGLMKSAALELGKYKITVNALIPGLVATPLTFNEARLRAAIAEADAIPNRRKIPRLNRRRRPARRTSRWASPGCSPRISPPSRFFLLQTRLPWSPARATIPPAATTP
jgi:NAD(P)-dependent dehydrogenase (short-subunit alcohol dehydrogenase family)